MSTMSGEAASQLDLTDPRLLSPLRWDERGKRLWLLDQLRLPGQEQWLPYAGHGEVARAITDMVVRGAPAIGIAAAYGVVLGALEGAPMPQVIDTLRRTRPTAVNLFWALERMATVAGGESPADRAALAAALEREAIAIHREDVASCLAMGALGVIRSAVASGTPLTVFADETRPFLQGARLTCWELQKSGIDVTLITDNMAAHLMARGQVQSIIVGADRIARSGDVANKIGTYGLAVLAKEHGIPFFVAAPRSTIDLRTPDGAAIPIEERSAAEVTSLSGVRIAPEGVPARHPAFDVTPARLVHAIITEAGVARAPYAESLPRLFG